MANPYVTQIVTCALPGCGKQKGDVNHWYLIVTGHDDGSMFVVYEWDKDMLRVKRVVPVCGQAHLILMLSRLMNGQETVCQKQS
jgi:hypothetical protein